MRLRNIKGADEAVANSPFCIHTPTEHKGNWKSLFSNDHPLHIEIGMGKGQFLLTLAAENPQINYVGIERYSSVLLRAVEKFQELEAEGKAPANIRFICMDANDLPTVFAPAEVCRIYLNFSDPWPKDRHAKRRLTSHEFLARYEKILKKDGTLEFKTDNKDLFDFSLEEMKNAEGWELTAFTYDLHHDVVLSEGNVMTEYEEKFSSIGNPICKMEARFL